MQNGPGGDSDSVPKKPPGLGSSPAAPPHAGPINAPSPHLQLPMVWMSYTTDDEFEWSKGATAPTLHHYCSIDVLCTMYYVCMYLGAMPPTRQSPAQIQQGVCVLPHLDAGTLLGRMLFLSLPLSHRERCNSTQDMHPSGMHVHFRHAVFTVSPGVNDPAIPLLHRPQHVLSWSGRQVESTVIAVDMQLTRHVKQ